MVVRESFENTSYLFFSQVDGNPYVSSHDEVATTKNIRDSFRTRELEKLLGYTRGSNPLQFRWGGMLYQMSETAVR